MPRASQATPWTTTRTYPETTERDVVNSHDHTDPDPAHPSGIDNPDTPAPETAVANPAAPSASGSALGDEAYPAPLPAEQQERAQTIVDALANRIHHAAHTAGLMELTADALAEVVEAFGAEVDVERLRAALTRRWPEDAYPPTDLSNSTGQD